MLSDILDLSKVDATSLIDYLYAIFHRDFIANDTYLAEQIYINPRRYKKDEDKEIDFWHLITREQKEKVWQNRKPVWKTIGRYPDYRRAERLEWVKQILINHTDQAIKLFYHRETNKKRDIRLYLWAYDHDFVVILQKLGNTESFLVTSFYIDHNAKRQDYQKRYDNYISKDPDLEGCEWF